MRRVHKVDCPICKVRVFESHMLPSAKPRLENKVCKNGHDFIVSKSYIDCHVMTISGDTNG